MVINGKYWKIEYEPDHIHFYPMQLSGFWDDYCCVTPLNDKGYISRNCLEKCMEQLTYERIRWIVSGCLLDKRIMFYKYKDGKLIPGGSLRYV